MLYNKIYQKKKTDIYSVHYLNNNGEKVSVFSPFSLINSEICLLGIETKDKSIKEIHNKISQLSLENYTELNLEGNVNCSILKGNQIKFSVLLHHLKELNYWLYDYNPNKMPKDVGFDYTLRR
jgi:hypothetical protein